MNHKNECLGIVVSDEEFEKMKPETKREWIDTMEDPTHTVHENGITKVPIEKDQPLREL
jgi:hypothetical protein